MRDFVVYNRCEQIQQASWLSVKARRIVSRVSVLQNRVLLLNGSTWEPLSVITVQRAINLLLGGKAIAVEMTGLYTCTRSEPEVRSAVGHRLEAFMSMCRAANRIGAAKACWCATTIPASTVALSSAPW